MTKPYKIYVLEYARRKTHSSEVLVGDPHQTPMDMSYYMWLVVNDERVIAVDTGFTKETGERRKRAWVNDPNVMMDAIQIDPRRVTDVVISHLHWDHAGNFGLFPKANFILQESEMAFSTGKYIGYEVFRQALDVEDVVAMLRLNYGGRVRFVSGSKTLYPGIRVHWVGGHTAGTQIVEVQTESGVSVIASDAAHFYANMHQNRPFHIIHSVPCYIEGFQRMRTLAVDEQHILPGHDGKVMHMLPSVATGVVLLQ